MISRPLWATYIVTPEQKSSGILISELFEVRKWVVEKFHGISPGLNAFCKQQGVHAISSEEGRGVKLYSMRATTVVVVREEDWRSRVQF